MVKGFKQLDPLLIISQTNQDLFADYNNEVFLQESSKIKLILSGITIKRRIKKLLQRLLQEYGPLQLYFPAFHPYNYHFTAYAKAQADLKTIITIHDYYTHKGERSSLIEALQKKSILDCDKVICLTAYVKQQLDTDLGQGEKTTVFPHPIIDLGIKNTLAYSPQPRLLFLGRGVKYKGLENLISAIADLPIQQLTVAGKMTDSLTATSEKIDIIDDYISEDRMKELLLSHHILVLPYTEASQSGILTIGIAAEMVIVISKVGGLEEQLASDAAIWVAPTVASLKAGLQELIGSRTRYEGTKSMVRKYRLMMDRDQDLQKTNSPK